VINAIFFRARAGCSWRDLPAAFGNWKTVYNTHRRWSLDGTWEKILDGRRAGCDEADGPGLDGQHGLHHGARQHAAGPAVPVPVPVELVTGRLYASGAPGLLWFGWDLNKQPSPAAGGW
jgi:hypothetical protein